MDYKTINVGCTVKVQDKDTKEEFEFSLVGSTEANSLENKISNESPLGHALIGSKVGKTIKFETPMGECKYKVIEIRKN